MVIYVHKNIHIEERNNGLENLIIIKIYKINSLMYVDKIASIRIMFR